MNAGSNLAPRAGESRAASVKASLRPLWRSAWGAYCDVRKHVRSRLGAVREGGRLALDPANATIYDASGAPQKPVARRLAENVWWAVREGRHNRFYYAFHMDKREGRTRDTVLSAEDMRRLIWRQIDADGARHPMAVLKDKYFFSLVAEALGHASPRTLAILTPSGVDLLSPRRSTTYEGLVEDGVARDGFAKRIDGQKGQGAFALRTEAGQAWVDGTPATSAEIAARIRGRFLLQERIEQHPALAALHAPSVNTIRLVTVLRDGEVTPLVAALRVGVGGNSIDNWSAGGLVVGLDIETGRLFGRGIFKPECGSETRYGGVVDRHPDSGILLDGYALPDIPEAVALAQRFHRDMGGPRSVGWDLTLTPNGPVVVEGNSHWSGAMYMAISPDFKRRYLDAVCLPGEIRP